MPHPGPPTPAAAGGSNAALESGFAKGAGRLETAIRRCVSRGEIRSWNSVGAAHGAVWAMGMRGSSSCSRAVMPADRATTAPTRAARRARPTSRNYSSEVCDWLKTVHPPRWRIFNHPSCRDRAAARRRPGTSSALAGALPTRRPPRDGRSGRKSRPDRGRQGGRSRAHS